MIEIIEEEVEMPSPYKRRFIKKSLDYGKNWQVIDTQTDNKIMFSGSFMNVAIASHNLNKRYYKQKQLESTERE